MLGRFKDVIIQAGLHRLHRNLFIARPGEHDDGAIRPAAFNGEQHADTIAPVQLVVGHDQVPGTSLEGRRELIGVAHLSKMAIRKFTAQFANHQCSIIRVILYQENIQSAAHNDPFFSVRRLDTGSASLAVPAFHSAAANRCSSA